MTIQHVVEVVIIAVVIYAAVRDTGLMAHPDEGSQK